MTVASVCWDQRCSDPLLGGHRSDATTVLWAHLQCPSRTEREVQRHCKKRAPHPSEYFWTMKNGGSSSLVMDICMQEGKLNSSGKLAVRRDVAG